MRLPKTHKLRLCIKKSQVNSRRYSGVSNGAPQSSGCRRERKNWGPRIDQRSHGSLPRVVPRAWAWAKFKQKSEILGLMSMSLWCARSLLEWLPIHFYLWMTEPCKVIREKRNHITAPEIKQWMTGHCPSHERCTTVSTTEQLGNRDNERYRKNKVDSGWRMHTFPNSPKRKKLQNTKNLRDRIYSHQLKISMKINNQTI